MFQQRRTITTSIRTEHSRARRIRPAATRVLLAVIAAASIAGYSAWRHLHALPASAAIVIADFVNSTGDNTFDHTLKRALEIDLEQSPYMDILSDRAGVDTLKLMDLPSDTLITADVGREICERTNRNVLLSGTLASVGQRYLLTLEASDCATGRRLSSAKAQAASKEHLLEALDSVTETVRRSLNESSKSVAAYEVPLREATTSSLEALRAYSVGKYLQSQGRPRTEIIATFQRAVDLDPNFAMAYRELGSENYNLNQNALASAYFKKAFELSDHLSAIEQLDIRACYYADGQHDILQGIKAFELASATFPRDPLAAVNAIDAYIRLGQYGPAIATGERNLKLFPDNVLIYENLSEAYRDVNRFDASLAATNRAAQIGKGDTGYHLALFELALVQHDQATLDRETQWFDSQENGTAVWYYPSFRGDAAASAGRYKQAQDLYQRAYESARRAMLPETADKILIAQALTQSRLGYTEAGLATLHGIAIADAQSPEVAAAYAELGDLALAERFLAAHAAPSPDTLLSFVYLPRIRAALALKQARPLEAIAALRSSTPFELRDYTIPTLRAEAFLQAHQPEKAAEEFRKVTSNPGIDPTSVLYPLAHLGLARACAMAGRTADSRIAYQVFLTDWKEADPNLPILKAAKQELARLPTR